MTESDHMPLDLVCTALRRIAVELDDSPSAASALESLIASRFFDDDRFDDIIHILASYRSGGGEFLFDEAALKRECEHVLKLLES